MNKSNIEFALDASGYRFNALLPFFAGFFLIGRSCLTFLFFQSNPATGSLTIIATSLLLFYVAVLSHGDMTGFNACRLVPPLAWAAMYLAFAGASITWTGAQSRTVAFAYWIGMTADLGAAVVLRSDSSTRAENLDQLLKGSVWGGLFLAAVAWLSPALPDLRLGDVVYLHPNTLGLQLGITSLIALYLVSSGRGWRWAAICLAITLLRTLSKTSIIAFLAAGGWMLLYARSIPRARKFQILLFVAFVIICFSGLISSYLLIYNNTASGNQVETLTGRPILWATAIGMGLQSPWLGHGLYSFRALIPALGDFEPWHAHNELIQIFFEFGVVGIAIAAGLHWSFFRSIRRAHAPLRVLGLSLLIFSLVHGLTDTVPFGFSLPLWLIAVLSLAGSEPLRDSEVLS